MAGRRPKTDRVPRTRANGEWTESAFIGFVRSGLRQLSTRWPPIADALRKNRRPYDGPNKRQKFEHQCECCKGWFPAAVTIGGKRKKRIHVDHIVPCGKLLTLDDASGFLKRMLVESEGLRLLCEACHALRTAKTREGESDE